MLTILLFLFDVVVGYLIGSVCSAVIVCRLFDLPDPRLEGSKNPGATNVLRIAGKQYAVMVLFADMLKGLLPVLLVKMLGAGPVAASMTCLAAVVGHMYPVFFEFKGGKGVATALGALLALHFMLGVTVIATWLIVANFARYSSLASMVSILLAPFYSLFLIKTPDAFLPLLVIALFVLYKHRDNITRLMDGTESKIRFRHKVRQDLVMTELKEREKVQDTPAAKVIPATKKKSAKAEKPVRAVKSKKPTKTKPKK